MLRYPQDQLFKGLAITQTSAGRTLLAQELPVVFLRMNDAAAINGPEVLQKEVSRLLLEEADRNGAYVQPEDETASSTLSRVITAIRGSNLEQK